MPRTGYKKIKSDLFPLFKTASFLVEEDRNSFLDRKERIKRQKKSLSGRVLHFLHKFGFPGLGLYLLFTSRNSLSCSMFRGIIIEDHSSSIIRRSLERVFGSSAGSELYRSNGRAFYGLLWYIRNVFHLGRLYKELEMDSITEFVRIARLFGYYIRWTGVFEKLSPKAVFIARTNDQRRLAAGAAAERYGVPLTAYLVERIRLQPAAPFSVDLYMCWTTRQADVFRRGGAEAAQMPVPYIRSMKLPVAEPGRISCGFLLNAKCDFAKVNEFINMLTRRYGFGNISVRPHPGTSVEKLSGLKGADVSDWREALHDYFERTDLVFAVNTNASIDAVLHGVPVVYAGGLDPYDYDLHGFVESGYIFPFSDDVTFPDSVNRFYKSDLFKKSGIREMFTDDVFPERKFIRNIVNKTV